MTDENVDAAVAAATSEENFDALDFFADASLPETSVTLYRDTASAYRINEIKALKASQTELEETEGIGLTDEVEPVDDDELDALIRKFNNSAVIFNLRAVAPAERTALEKESRAKNPYKEGAENTEYLEAFNGSLIAKSIVSVTNAKGQRDSNTWDAARVIKFADVLEPNEWAKLTEKVYGLNFVGDAINQAVSADF